MANKMQIVKTYLFRSINEIFFYLTMFSRPKLHKVAAHYVKIFGIRGSRNSQIFIGTGSICHARISMDRAGASVRIGSRSYIGDSHIVASEKITIGDDVMISWGVSIVDHDSHSIRFKNRRNDVHNWTFNKKEWHDVNVKPVFISNKVWIGFGATILKGVTIGEGAIVGAKSVITHDVPPWTIVAGNPAKIIKELDIE